MNRVGIFRLGAEMLQQEHPDSRRPAHLRESLLCIRHDRIDTQFTIMRALFQGIPEVFFQDDGGPMTRINILA